MKRKRSKRTTEIKVESEEIFLLRSLQKPIRAWCTKCAAEVRVVSPEEAARVAGVDTRTIYRWVEAGKVHFAEVADGKMFICLQSLA